MKKIFFTFILLFFISIIGFAQRTITGTVTDENQEIIMFASVKVKGTEIGTTTDFDGKYKIEIPEMEKPILVFSYIGIVAKEIEVKKDINIIDVELLMVATLDEIVVTYAIPLIVQDNTSSGHVVTGKEIPKLSKKRRFGKKKTKKKPLKSPEPNSESYARINENTFATVKRKPLSTFSIDVDKAAYSNIRRFINNGEKPSKDAVRIEEMINYFNYDYATPKDEHPIVVHTELGNCPWNEKHQLIKVGLKAKELSKDNLPPSNLVFLLDVSGSMGSSLQLVKEAMAILVEELREEDKVSIVVYAGATGLVLEPTSGSDKETILNAMNKLQAGGGTAGGAGIQLAYKVAEEQFMKGGNNRIILATDGDFNIGMSSNRAMEDLIVEKRETGIYLTCLGFGMGNYKDDKMELLADKGNGNYAYIDTKDEAVKVFQTEFSGTMFTIAKDVKFQLEFNPAVVAAYRLIGYENRLLEEEDFDNDAKDAGEIGIGHTVTALYEIIPVDVESAFLQKKQKLKYQRNKANRNKKTAELLTVKLRYKPIESKKSIKLEYPVKYNLPKNNSVDFQFASSIALFGMLLRDSEYIKNGNYEMALELAKKGKGDDEKGYRKEYIELIQKVDVKLISAETEED